MQNPWTPPEGIEEGASAPSTPEASWPVHTVILYAADDKFMLFDMAEFDVIFDGYTLDAALQEAERVKAEGHFVAIDLDLVKETIPSIPIPADIVKASVEKARRGLRDAFLAEGCPPEAAEEFGNRMAEIHAQKFGTPS